MLDQPPSVDTTTSTGTTDAPDWSQLARMGFEASTSWLNSSRRTQWNDSLRQFSGHHPSGSKYASNDYRYRSRLFRPKSRALVRRAEAAAAAAFFSTADIISISARDDDDPKQKASADLNQELLQLRLTTTIPWFLTLVGARQDCEVMGIAVGKVHWRFAERLKSSETRPHMDEAGEPVMGEDGEPQMEQVDTYEQQHDQLQIDLIPPENFRFDPGADWRDPVGTSPYIIHRIPMYVTDVRERMATNDPKTGQPPWKKYDDATIGQAREMDQDTTRRVREQGRQDSKDQQSEKPREYDIVWVHENIFRHAGRDWHYWTLGRAGKLLTEPRPAEEVYFHDPRPFVVGYANLEAHKTYPASKLELIRDLQIYANDDVNLRLDALKLSLNPRQKVVKGRGIDLNDVRTFMPGKTVLVTAADDVTWEESPQVPEGAYLEQDRINVDMDELSGSNQAMPAMKDFAEVKATGMNMMSAAAGTLADYELRIFAETWVEPVLRKAIKAIQKYETDATILAIAGQKAQLVQRYGVDQVTDELLDQELTISVNVGIGATDPKQKLANFMQGSQIIGNIFGPVAAQGANFEEVGAEVFGLLGYKDGKRFFQPGFDPGKAMLQQQLQHLQQKGGQQVDTPNDLAQTQIEQFKAQVEARKADAEATFKMMELRHRAFFEMEKLKQGQQDANTESLENAGKHDFEKQKTALSEMREHGKLSHQREAEAVKLAIEAAKLELEAQKFGVQQSDPVEHLKQSTLALQELGGKMGEFAQQFGEAHAQVSKGLLGVLNHINSPKEIMRDVDGNVVGVKPGQANPETDLEAALDKLSSPRSFVRDGAGELAGSV